MTPHITGALTGALTQLAALNRGELAVLAAAAHALAAAQPQSSRPKTRRRASHRTDGAGRHGKLGDGATGSGPIASGTDAGKTISTGAGVGRPAPVGPLDGGVNGLRLRGRGRLLAYACQPVDPELFSSAAYRRRLGPSMPGLLYAAGCDGVLTLANRLDRPLFKVGTTEAPSTAQRMLTLAAERYGSVVRDGDGWREEDGFDRWRAVGLPLTKRRGHMSPVRSAIGAIGFARPVSLPQGALDRAVAAALAPAGLAAFAASDEGRAACRERAIEPASLDRYSPAPLGCAPGRYEQAHELVLLGPRADADRLACVLEAVIAAHVMGRDPG